MFSKRKQEGNEYTLELLLTIINTLLVIAIIFSILLSLKILLKVDKLLTIKLKEKDTEKIGKNHDNILA